MTTLDAKGWYYAETQDEQKALEAAKWAPSEFFAEHGSRIEPQDRLTIECRAYHAAMTEDGVWISKEDAEAFASVKWKSTDKDNMEFSATTTCYVMDRLRPAISRLLAKLDGPTPALAICIAAPQAQGSESEPDKLEKAARAIYDMMPFDGVGSEKKPAWVEGGNSLKQDEARRYARAAAVAVLKGIRVPTLGMCDAGMNSPIPYNDETPIMGPAFTAMIDALLAQIEGGNRGTN